MQPTIRLTLFIILTLFAINTIHAQTDTSLYNKDRHKIPPIKTQPAPQGYNELMNAPDQIGFGKIGVDGEIQPQQYTMKQRILDSSYRSLRLYVAIHKKDFNEWEQRSFKNTEFILQLNLGNPPQQMSTGVSLTSIFSLFAKKRNPAVPVITTEDNYQFQKQWKEAQRIEREKKLYEQYEQQTKTKDEPSFGLPLQDMIHDFLYSTDYVCF